MTGGVAAVLLLLHFVVLTSLTPCFCRFLRYEPFNHPKHFKKLIKDDIAYKPERGFKKLQTVLQAVLLRRTKTTKLNGEPIVQLPGREAKLVKVCVS